LSAVPIRGPLLGDTKRVWLFHCHRSPDSPKLLIAGREEPYLLCNGIRAMVVLAVAHSISARSMDNGRITAGVIANCTSCVDGSRIARGELSF